jgi:hypothetical protein
MKWLKSLVLGKGSESDESVKDRMLDDAVSTSSMTGRSQSSIGPEPEAALPTKGRKAGPTSSTGTSPTKARRSSSRHDREEAGSRDRTRPPRPHPGSNGKELERTPSGRDRAPQRAPSRSHDTSSARPRHQQEGAASSTVGRFASIASGSFVRVASTEDAAAMDSSYALATAQKEADMAAKRLVDLQKAREAELQVCRCLLLCHACCGETQH